MHERSRKLVFLFGAHDIRNGRFNINISSRNVRFFFSLSNHMYAVPTVKEFIHALTSVSFRTSYRCQNKVKIATKTLASRLIIFFGEIRYCCTEDGRLYCDSAFIDGKARICVHTFHA